MKILLVKKDKCAIIAERGNIMAIGKKYEIDMTTGPILKKMIAFAFPLMCSSILQLLFNAADTIVVGKFAGDNSLAAVGSNGSLINLMTNLFIGLSIGTNVLIGKSVGANDKEHTEKLVHTSMAVSVIGGVFLMLFGITFAERILILMDSPAEVLPLATQYLKIYFIGLPAMMIYNFGSAVLRAVGDTKRPLYYLTVAGVINVIFNLLFVIRFKMDVAGVAWATVISQIVSALFIITCLIKQDSYIRLRPGNLKIDPDSLKRIIRIGIPAGIQGCLFSFSNVIIQSSINSFGATVVAGSSAAQNIEGFTYVSMNAFHQATLTFTSQNVGAGRFDRVGKILARGLICVTVTGITIGYLEILFGHQLLGIYSNDFSVIEKGFERLLIMSGTHFLCGFMDVLVGSIRGLGYSVLPMIVSLIGACGLRILYIKTLFRMEMFHSTKYIYITYPISWLMTIIAHVICYMIIRQKIMKERA